MKTINESLEHHAMRSQVHNVVGIDQFKSNIGSDSNMIVLNFTVKSKQAAIDLADWIERGYEWIVDADTSPGEVLENKFYVFAELNRKATAPTRIIELLDDMSTLTDIDVDQWRMKINNKLYPASEDTIKKHVSLDPREYQQEHEKDLNEWRTIAGLPITRSAPHDEEITAWQRQAGII